jgi:hypothetical protein
MRISVTLLSFLILVEFLQASFYTQIETYIEVYASIIAKSPTCFNLSAS